MNKRTYFRNRIIEDSKLPFRLEITTGLTVYAVEEKGQMRKTASIFLKRKQWIIVNHDGFIITIKGYNQPKTKKLKNGKTKIIEGKFIYEIQKEKS